MSSVIEELSPFQYLNFNDFFPSSAINRYPTGWNCMKLIHYVYDHGAVMHMQFNQCIISYRGVIAL